MQMQMVVGRIILKRAIRCKVVTSSVIRLEIVISSEFNEPIPGLLAFYQNDLKAFFEPINENSNTDMIDSNLCLLNPVDAQEVCIYQVICPHSSGKYRLHIKSSFNGPVDIGGDVHKSRIILDFLSDVIEITSNNNEVNGYVPSLLSNYRSVTIGSRVASTPPSPLTITIQEEYGASMGSHIYDSAIVLCHYFNNNPLIYKRSDTHEYASALELGSGCGLVGLWLKCSDYYKRVVLTDKIALQSLIQQNISTNISDIDIDSGCFFLPLEWSSSSNVASVMNSQKMPFSLVVAADVLYGTKVSTAFFNVLENVITQHRETHTLSMDPAIIVAQKVRSDEPLDLANVSGVSIHASFDATLIHEAFSVKIWSVKHK
jgi:hypothetical protein